MMLCFLRFFVFVLFCQFFVSSAFASGANKLHLLQIDDDDKDPSSLEELLLPQSGEEEEMSLLPRGARQGSSSSDDITVGISLSHSNTPPEQTLKTEEVKQGVVVSIQTDEKKEKLENALSELLRTNWSKRDKIILGVNLVIFGGTYYFLQEGVRASWIGDFWNTCMGNNLPCFIWQKVYSANEVTRLKISDYFVVPNVAIAWSF
ncbi:MAG: hypothetical protein HEEMFOPI_01648 [Holosporales bacterium]